MISPAHARYSCVAHLGTPGDNGELTHCAFVTQMWVTDNLSLREENDINVCEMIVWRFGTD